MQDGADAVQPRLHLMLIATIVRMIVFAAHQFVRHVLLRRHGARPVVRVPVALMVAPVLHQLGRRVSEVQRHLADAPGVHVGERLVDGQVAGVGFGRGGHGHGGLRQDDACLGHADHSHGLRGGDRDLQDLRGGHADLLGGGDHDAPGDEPGVLPRTDHTGQVMQRGVDV